MDRGPAEEQVSEKADASTATPLVGSVQETPKAKEGTLYLLNVDPLAKVYINDREVDGQGVGNRVPLFEKVEVRVIRDGFFPYEETFQLTENNPTLEVEVPELKKGKMGLLSTSVKYSGKKLYIKINGKVKTKDLPITNMRVPAGQYKGIIYDPKSDQKESVRIRIEENKRYFLD